jgi:hypothetical protein
VETQTESAALPDLDQLAAAELPQALPADTAPAPSVADKEEEYQVPHAGGEVHTGTLRGAIDVCPYVAALLARAGAAEATSQLAKFDVSQHTSLAERMAARGRAKRMAEEAAAEKPALPAPTKEKPVEPAAATASAPVPTLPEKPNIRYAPYTPPPPEVCDTSALERPEQLPPEIRKHESQPQPVIIPEQHAALVARVAESVSLVVPAPPELPRQLPAPVTVKPSEPEHRPQLPPPPPAKQELYVPPAVAAAAETVAIDIEKPAVHDTSVAEWQPEAATTRSAVQLEGAGAANTAGTVEMLAVVLPEDPEQEDKTTSLTERAPEAIALSYPKYNEEYVAAIEEIFTEWLHAELPDEATEPTEESQSTPSIPELPLETKAAVHAILERMTDAASEIAAEIKTGINPVAEVAEQEAEQQMEVWCTQLLETLGLRAEPAAVQALAKRLVFLTRSNRSAFWGADAALDAGDAYVDPGTHERKQSIITAIRQHVTQAVQRLQRFLAAGRYILASVASPG